VEERISIRKLDAVPACTTRTWGSKLLSIWAICGAECAGGVAAADAPFAASGVSQTTTLTSRRGYRQMLLSWLLSDDNLNLDRDRRKLRLSSSVQAHANRMATLMKLCAHRISLNHPTRIYTKTKSNKVSLIGAEVRMVVCRRRTSVENRMSDRTGK